MSNNLLELIRLQVGPLDAVSLTVAAGESIMLAGVSGSGKSRLLRAIADLDPAMGGSDALAQGQIKLAGVNHLHYSGAAWRRRVAYVAAENQWWFDDVLSHFEHRPSTAQLQLLRLDENLLQQPVSHLSSGERQRLALLRVLVQQPQVLLLDEPTASLDPAATRAVEQIIMNYRDQHQAAIIWVSHDEAQAQRLGGRYFYLDQGVLEQKQVFS